MSVEVPLGELRPIIGKRVDAAHYADEATVITVHGQPHAAIVSYETYRSLTGADTERSTIYSPDSTHEKTR